MRCYKLSTIITITYHKDDLFVEPQPWTHGLKAIPWCTTATGPRGPGVTRAGLRDALVNPIRP